VSDAAVLERIVAKSGVGPSSVVLEVGPGLGTLTATLLGAGALVVAAEIDRGLIKHLAQAFSGIEDFVLVEGDAMARRGRLADGVLRALADALARRKAPGFHVVSNLPYGISTSFLASLAFEPGPPIRATVMLQSEVAAVLLARASTDAYSALSVFAGTYFDVRREFEVGRHAFFPQPDVDSTVVSLAPKAGDHPPPASFGLFVQKLFQGRRKALATTLRGLLPAGPGIAKGVLDRAGVDPSDRVDALDPARIAALFRAVDAASRPT